MIALLLALAFTSAPLAQRPAGDAAAFAAALGTEYRATSNITYQTASGMDLNLGRAPDDSRWPPRWFRPRSDAARVQRDRGVSDEERRGEGSLAADRVPTVAVTVTARR